MERSNSDWVLNCALLAYMSDMGMVDAIRQPYQHEVAISMSTSLDHTIHFHREFDPNEWLCVIQLLFFAAFSHAALCDSPRCCGSGRGSVTINHQTPK